MTPERFDALVAYLMLVCTIIIALAVTYAAVKWAIA